MGSLHRRFWVFLASAAVVAGSWKYLPGSALDRAAFTQVVRSLKSPPWIIEGGGTVDAPWKVWSAAAETKDHAWQAPVVVSLGDDVEGFFQASPPAPIDLAVVLKNFLRLGAKDAATAVVLAWDAPDPIGLAALETALGAFDSLVMAAPLSRGSAASAMPPAFRRASIPLTSVRGEILSLPVVNRVPVASVILTASNTLAGFSVIESEAVSAFPPLMACWEDRVVFSFPLLAALQRLHLSPAGLEIHLGEYLKLGPNGPLVPIDEYGRLAVPLATLTPVAEISAEAVIDGVAGLFPQPTPGPVILRDDRTTAEPATQAFSRQLSATLATIGSPQRFTSFHTYRRLALDWEIGILAGVVCLLTLFSGMVNFPRQVGAMLLVAVTCAAQWIWLETASVWLPGLPLLGAIAAAVIVSKGIAISLPAAE